MALSRNITLKYEARDVFYMAENDPVKPKRVIAPPPKPLDSSTDRYIAKGYTPECKKTKNELKKANK